MWFINKQANKHIPEKSYFRLTHINVWNTVCLQMIYIHQFDYINISLVSKHDINESNIYVKVFIVN